jgi:rhodanese-related sulfurtransferase
MSLERNGLVSRVFSIFAALAWIMLAGSAQASDIEKATLGETSPTADISTAEMQQVLKDGSAIVIDTRTIAEFDAGHIPGARLVERISKNGPETVRKITGGDKAAKLVLYCNGPYCQASRNLARELVAAGYTNVQRYQLGLPVWRALGGGPIAIEQDAVVRVFKADRTAVFVDTRPAAVFAKGSLPDALNIPADELAAGRLKKLPLPDDDFNRRVVLFGDDGSQARKVAEMLTKRPWHNVSYFSGSLSTLRAVLLAH